MSNEMTVTLLVLFAAFSHALWNTVIKIGSDKLLAALLVHGTAMFIAAAIVPFVEPPSRGSLGLLAISVILHGGYRFFLLQSYRVGDLSHVYPIARGVSPLGVAALAGILAGEHLSLWEYIGVATISVGLFSISYKKGGFERDQRNPVIFAVCTGFFIASYTVVDGLGVRATGSPFGYILWMYILDGMILVPFALYFRQGRVMQYLKSNWRAGIFGGVMSFIAYGLVMWTLSFGSMVYIAALRETSVVFAAVIGIYYLREGFGWKRIISSAVIVAGIAVLQF